MTSRIFNLACKSIILLCFATNGHAGGRWSRQLTAESLGDWVPLEPVADLNKRQASARVLNQPTPFQSSFFPADSSPNDYAPQESPRQLYVQSMPTGQQAYLHQNQPIVQLTLTDPQYNPLAQAFVSQPYNTNLQNMQFAQIPLPSQIVQNPVNLNNQFYSAINKQNQQNQKKPEASRYVDGYKLENSSVDYFQANNKKKPTTTNLKNKQEQIYKPQQQQRVTERSSTTIQTTPSGVEKEEVQLLYVPLETLQNEKFNAKQYFKTPQQQQEALRDSVGSPGQINNQLYTPTTPNYSQRQQSQLQNIQQELIQQAYNAQTLQGKFKQNQYDRQPKYQQQTQSTISFPFSQSVYPTPVITTPKSKKLKAHQPPLAIFMYQKPNDHAKLTDVLTMLKGAKQISVLDNIGPHSPKVFIGPSTLKIPDYYTKFDLPYLSSVDGNRIQRKVDQLPFFVAPLSYKAPDGFAKIPFPAPHVGSVIINPFMNDLQNSRPLENFPSSYSYSTFQNNPSTESFRSTYNEQTTLKQNPFNYFSSATPNPIVPPQSTVSTYQSSFLPYEQQTFNSFRPLPPSKQPETNVISSSRQPPLASYYSQTPSKPTVSYFSFASPEYTTPTTIKAPTTQNYLYRGHYITNSAVDGNSNNIKTKTTPKETTRDVYRTTPVPVFSPTLPTHNPYSINNAFQPTGSQESSDILKNPKVNEVREYNTEPPTEKIVQNLNTYSQNSAPIENSQYSAFNDFSPIPYYGQSNTDKPNEYASQTESSSPSNSNDNRESYSPVQYQNPSGNDDGSQYQTEYQSYNDITTPSTTTTSTTTTTTTVAPTTKATRRPIHSRGRPRYTTQKPDGDHVTRATTRRTPIRERKPNNYRSRQETTKASSTEATVTESSNFESSKRGKAPETTESSKINRYSGYRNKPAEEEVKTTTESSLPKTSAANRNQRLRSRGKTHFRITDNNYEASDLPGKKSKKAGNGNGESIAYQRDVLHQNYPVTLTERMSTIEIHTTPTIPSSQGIDLTNGKIRIYETTGSTQKSYPAQDTKSSESLLEYYDNQPVFQGESQKYLTQPESYIEVSSERSGNTAAPEVYITAKESSTERVEPSSSLKYEPEIQAVIDDQKIIDQYESDKEKAFDNQEIPEDASERIPESVFETPVARFRSKLRSRPKVLAVVNSQNVDNDYESKSVNSVAVNKKPIDESDNTFSITRRSSLQPVTYRPAFDKRRTTMRIEEIEAELKSSRRQQSRSNLHSSTLKYPVYVPESSSSNPINDNESVEITTKRNHFVRRRPVKPTASSVSSTSRPRASAEQSSIESPTNKRVRVRTRLRTRPTTEKPEDIKQEESTESYPVDEKYAKSTERISSQKYTTRGRLATQKYLKKSSPVTERTIQISKEIEDQASYDSINRPEYVEYNPIKSDYNPENGKAESHWSPKLTYNSFKPIFNPNFIADDIKPEGIEYGTKLPQSEFDDENSEIITAGSPFDDMLIAVTPASNNLNGDTSNKNFGKSFYDNKNDNENVKKSPSSLSFESVLEEVMKNLEEQDENEYDTDYNKSVMKHESGEIGEIPPEIENPLKSENTFEIKKIEDNQKLKSNADEEVFVENKISTSTERQARRRGVWRRVKVRPVNKDMLEGAESQFYTNANDLIKNDEKSKDITKVVEKSNDEKHIAEDIPKNHKPEELPRNHKAEPIPKNHKPEELPKNHKPEKIEEEESTTIVSEAYTTTEKITSPGDMDLGIGSPEAAIYENVSEPNDSQKDSIDKILLEEIAEEIKSIEENKEDVVTEFKNEDVTQNSNKTEINYTQRSVVTLISKEHSPSPTTTETPLAIPMEFETEHEETTPVPVDETFSSQNTEAPQEIEEITTKSEETTIKPEPVEEIVSKIESIESTTAAAVNYWDPKNIISTSMSTEVSHETEICYRGRCIKTKKEDHKKVIT